VQYGKIIVDADLCNKLGDSAKYPYLRILLPLLADMVYIHRIVYDEIMMSAQVKAQIHDLISEGFMKIVDESDLDAAEAIVYKSTWTLLARRMMNPNNPRKNKGEVASLSFAKTRSIPIFATDEMNLQPIIDAVLNTGMNDIKCLRIIDLVKKIKAGEFPSLARKDAKVIWRMAEKKKEHFDQDVWPLENK